MPQQIQVPGPFTVLQGTKGDGLSNTVDSMPHLPALRSPLCYPNAASTGANGRENNEEDTCSLTGSSPHNTDDSTSIKREAAATTKPAKEAGNDNCVSNNNNNHNAEMLDEFSDEEGYQYVEYASVSPMDNDHIVATTPTKRSIRQAKQNLLLPSTTTGKQTNKSEVSRTSAQTPRVREEGTPTHGAALFIQTSAVWSTEQQSANNNFTVNAATIDDSTLKQWERECRTREKSDFLEMLRQNKHSHKFLQLCSTTQGNHDISTFDAIAWWQRKGQLAVFASPKVHPGNYLDDDSDDDFSQQPRSSDDVDIVLGTLPPGTIVWGLEFVDVPVKQQDGEEMLDYVFLRIDSPIAGYVLYSQFLHAYLTPGTPLDCVNPCQWIWRISCLDGAFVREGLDLSSRHIATLPFGTFVGVSQKTVNSMGLSRLRIERHHQCHNNENECTSETSMSNVRRRRSPNDESSSIAQSNAEIPHFLRNNHYRVPTTPRLCATVEMVEPKITDLQLSSVDSVQYSSPNTRHNGEFDTSIGGGWISEALNPLSGQCGSVAQPLSFPVPALYRVSFPEGAVIRSDIELSSMQIGTAPYGSILKVVGRTFSEHPMDQCIDRLKLAGGAGWISVRLNKPPPYNMLIVELIGVDGEFDVANPGIYHLKALETSISNSFFGDDTNSATEKIPEDEHFQLFYQGDTNNDNKIQERSATKCSGSEQQQQQEQKRSVAATQRRSNNDRRRHYNTKEVNEDKCLICLTEERSATIVHGFTGHIACCLTCARILKARGDRCPVCRLPIDSVIQQFWA